jgi:hypothetical protein
LLLLLWGRGLLLLLLLLLLLWGRGLLLLLSLRDRGVLLLLSLWGRGLLLLLWGRGLLVLLLCSSCTCCSLLPACVLLLLSFDSPALSLPCMDLLCLQH